MIKLDQNSKTKIPADLLKITNHENLVAINRHILVEYQLYILRDYLEDFINLNQRLKQDQKVDENILIQRWLLQIVDALEYMHANDVYHGNLKLENVLVRSKDNHIKLTDLGLNVPCGGSSLDVYLLGCLLFRCITLDLDSKEINVDSLESMEQITKRSKKFIKQMLELNSDSRPTLSDLKSQLINPFCADLSRAEGRIIEIDRKILILEATSDRNEFLAISSKKRRNMIGISMSRIKFVQDSASSSSMGIFERLNFHSSLIMTRNRSSCSCSRYANMPDYYYPSLLPKLFCVIEANFLIGCNSNYMYFFDDRLKYVKRICLLEALEKVPNYSRKNLNYHRRHSTMVQKHLLRLEVNSICVDKFQSSNNSSVKKLYLLLTVLNEICLLNIFNVDLIDFSKQTTESSSPTDVADPKLNLTSSMHLSVLNPKQTSKSMKCNQAYLFICERSHLVRVFSKQSVGKYLFSLDNSIKLITDQNRHFSDVKSRPQHIEIDKRNGYVYVAYDYMIKVLDENCELIWEFDVGERSDLNGRLVNVCLSSSGSMILVLEDLKNEFLNRICIFS